MRGTFKRTPVGALYRVDKVLVSQARLVGDQFSFYHIVLWMFK